MDSVFPTVFYILISASDKSVTDARLWTLSSSSKSHAKTWIAIFTPGATGCTDIMGLGR